jgi:hypothetical protein
MTRSPGHPRHPGDPAVRVRPSVGTRRRRTAGSLRAGRSSPAAAERILPRRLPRTRLIPVSSHRARGTRRLRAVRAIGARRNPAPVRQPVLTTGHRSAVRRAAVHGARAHRAPVHRACVYRAAVTGHAVRRVAVGRVSWGRREASRRAHARAARLVRARLRRRISGTPQQLAVFVVVRIVPAVRACAAVFPVGAALTQASSPGQAIGIAALAGVAAFHQVPPGPCCPAAPQDMPYLTSVGRGKSPVRRRRPIVINCT